MELTVYHDGQFFVGIITCKEQGKLYGARYIFGAEPSDEDVLMFVNGSLFQHFAKCGVEVKEKQRPKNIKRIIRQKKQMLNVLLRRKRRLVYLMNCINKKRKCSLRRSEKLKKKEDV